MGTWRYNIKMYYCYVFFYFLTIESDVIKYYEESYTK